MSITLLSPLHIIERLALYQHIPRVMRLSVSTLFSDDTETPPRNGLEAMYSSHHVELYPHTSVRLTRSVDTDIYIYIGCNRRKGPDFGRVFLMLNYTEKPPKHLYPKLNSLGDNGQ